MRRLLRVGVLAVIAWAVLSRRRPVEPRVVVGYDDGREAALETGSPERELLVGAAAEALRS